MSIIETVRSTTPLNWFSAAVAYGVLAVLFNVTADDVGVAWGPEMEGFFKAEALAFGLSAAVIGFLSIMIPAGAALRQ